MEDIAKRLSEIEMTARSIVENAEKTKHDQEHDMQVKRDEFDATLEVQTQERIDKIRAELLKNKDQLVGEQKTQNDKAMAALKEDFKAHHTEYAKEILDRLTEV